MLRKIALILAGAIFVGGFIYLAYFVFFGLGSQEYKDIDISYTEGALTDKERVTAECSISEENRFCFRDENWAKKQNAIEFDGYAKVEFKNTSDVITEISLATVKLENTTVGNYFLQDQEPSEIFLAEGESTTIYFDFSYDAEEDTIDQIKQDGVTLRLTFISEVGTKAVKEFTVEYQQN